MENKTIIERLNGLRAAMAKAGVTWTIFQVADYHNSEYVAPFFETLRYFSGFSGTNAWLLVSADEADLWTDGRYWIQAENETEGTGITLFRMGEKGVPTVNAYLKGKLKQGDVLGFDGKSFTSRQGIAYGKMAAEAGASVKADTDPAAAVWTDRPALPSHPLFILPPANAGKNFAWKVEDLRRVMKEQGTTAFLTNKIDDLMWLTNLRGGDVSETPVALSFGFVTETETYLFVQPSEVTDEVRAYCGSAGITLQDYNDFTAFLGNYRYTGKILADPAYLSYSQYEAALVGLVKSGVAENVSAADKALVRMDSPITYRKAIKSEEELTNIRAAYKDDSAAVIRFLYWLTHEADIDNMTELDAAAHLGGLRAQISDFLELSFATIAAYGPNAAMMHYDPQTVPAPAALARAGMLLVDSGGTYYRGTTDITRTTALGPVTDEMIKAYTLTTAANMGLLNAVFMHGCTGKNLDILAREPLWKVGSDYKCGTGHGIGYVLSVHEGPQNIRWRFTKDQVEAVFEPGMIVSDEPGVYRGGEFGIRIETILECVPAMSTADGDFLKFEPLTYVPLDRNLIDPQYLNSEQLAELNEYHRRTYETMAPYFAKEPAIRDWLAAQCAEIS